MAGKAQFASNKKSKCNGDCQHLAVNAPVTTICCGCTSSPRGDGYRRVRVYPGVHPPRCTSSPRGDGYKIIGTVASETRVAPHPHAGTDTRDRNPNHRNKLWLHLIPTRGRILTASFAISKAEFLLHLIPTRGRIPIDGAFTFRHKRVAPHPHAGTDTGRPGL